MLLAQLLLLVIVVAAFSAGYGLRAYISHRRRQRWKLAAWRSGPHL